MMGVAMVMVVGEHVLMRDASLVSNESCDSLYDSLVTAYLVSELVAVAIELRPIGGKHCTWSGNRII